MPTLVYSNYARGLMTPTLLGRWQTRLFLFATVGLFITVPFSLGIISPGGSIFFSVLIYVALFGLIWDILYIYIQKYRWDRDWPGVFQLLAGIWEAFFIFCVVNLFNLPGRNDLKMFWLQ